ncbi:MAG: hypothetical protein Q4F11_01135 [Eubacteriales bacterium]|nr:hypothetical protein [Eubacteriales bacterium]
MAVLLELKEKIKNFYNKYDVYAVPAFKFIIALISFIMLNSSIGYMSKLKNPLIAVMLSVLCAFLPNGATILMLSVYILANLYAISAEFAVITLCIMLIMYLLYFRFTPKSAYILIFTTILCWLKMPYLIPIAAGLCFSALSVIPVGFGVVIFYIIQTAGEYGTAITNQSVTDSVQQISYIVESLISDKQMLIVVLALVLTIVTVYCIRRLTVDNAWTYAIIAGTVIEFIILVVGETVFKAKLNIVLMIIGVALGAAIGYVCRILFFAVDFKRTEYVQYEDDEYYYYVKAVPKINVVNADVKVKQINARKTRRTDNIEDVRGYDMRHSENAATDEDDDIRIYDR